MAQRYSGETALGNMERGLCPECGQAAGSHLDDNRFWLPRTCDLLPAGVTERIEQYRARQS